MKRFICSILTLLLIVTMIPLASFANTVSAYQPVLSIGSSDIPSVDAGSSKTIYLTLKNSGYQARDVKITPVFEEPFTTNSLTSSISLGDLQSGSKSSVKLDINTNANALPGNYPIKLVFSYNYYAGDSSQIMIAFQYMNLLLLKKLFMCELQEKALYQNF